MGIRGKVKVNVRIPVTVSIPNQNKVNDRVIVYGPEKSDGWFNLEETKDQLPYSISKKSIFDPHSQESLTKLKDVFGSMRLQQYGESLEQAIKSPMNNRSLLEDIEIKKAVEQAGFAAIKATSTSESGINIINHNTAGLKLEPDVKTFNDVNRQIPEYKYTTQSTENIVDNLQKVNTLVEKHPILNKLSNDLVLIGPGIRDAIKGEPFKNIDLVSLTPLPELNEIPKSDSISYKLDTGNVTVNLWSIDKHKPIDRTGTELVQDKITSNFFFNVDTGSYNLRTGQVLVSQHIEALDSSELRLNKPLEDAKKEKDPAVAIVRAFGLSAQYGLTLNNEVKDYIKWWSEHSQDPLREVLNAMKQRYTDDANIEKHVMDGLVNVLGDKGNIFRNYIHDRKFKAQIEIQNAN